MRLQRIEVFIWGLLLPAVASLVRDGWLPRQIGKVIVIDWLAMVSDAARENPDEHASYRRVRDFFRLHKLRDKRR